MRFPVARIPVIAGFALLSAALGTPGFAQSPDLALVPKRPSRHRPVSPARILNNVQPEVAGGFSANYRVTPSSAGQTLGNGFGPLGSGSDWSEVGPAPLFTPGGSFASNTDTVTGRVAAIATDPTNANIYYIAPAGGGIWKTTDGGASYVPLTDLQPGLAMGAISVAASNHNVIYAGTGEANFSLDSRYGNGILKSTDGGASWTTIPGPSNVFVRRSVSSIVIDPTDANIAYVALTYPGSYGGVGGNLGVWKTTDGGLTWSNTTSGIASGFSNVPITSLAMDPTNRNKLFAAAGDIFGSSRNGVYVTTNGGSSWSASGNFPITSQNGRITLANAPSNAQVVYAAVTRSFSISNGGALLAIYKTTNGGTTWSPLTGTPNYLGGQGWYDSILIVNPTNANRVYAAGQVNYSGNLLGNLIGVIGSTNGGATWGDLSCAKDFEIPHTDHHAFAFTSDGKLLLGSDGGVWRLENAGTVTPVPSGSNPANGDVTWTNVNGNLNTLQFTGVALHPTDPTIAYGGAQDNGTSKFTGSVQWTQVRGGDGGFTRVDQSNPNTVYHEYYGVSVERSDDGGNNWALKIGGINTNDETVEDELTPQAFYIPYILDPGNQSHLLLGTNHLYESTNKGDNWSTLASPNVNGFNTVNDAIYCIGINGSTIYCGVGGRIYTSKNGGVNWTSSVPGGSATIFNDVYVNPNYANDVIVVHGDFTGSSARHVFRSLNGGTSWSDISGNLPDQPYNAVKLDKGSGTLFVGGDNGVYYSTDFGGSWARLGTKLPFVQVTDLAISPGAGILGAGTHGRGLWTYPLPSANGVIAHAKLVIQPSFTRTAGQLKIQIGIKNASNGDATNVRITSVTVNSVAVPGAAQNVGVVPAMATIQTTPANTSAPAGTSAVVRVSGTSDQGNFSSALRVNVP